MSNIEDIAARVTDLRELLERAKQLAESIAQDLPAAKAVIAKQEDGAVNLKTGEVHEW